MPLTLKKFNSLAEARGGKPRYRGATISVHGMNSRGDWQKTLAPCLQDADIRHYPVDYGRVTVGALRRKTIDGIANTILTAYEEQLKYHPQPSAIGHSLGTLAIGRLLRRKPDVSLRRIILFGSILDCRYPWAELQKEGRVHRVLNESCAKDIWPRVAPFVIPDSGPSGCVGFTDSSGVVIESRYEDTGHSELEY